MNEYRFLIDRLREIASGMDSPKRRTLNQAADALENQQSLIHELRQIAEFQADVNQRATDLALELEALTRTAMTPVKPKAYSTLCNMRKDELVEYIRNLEHNYSVAVSFNRQQAENFAKMEGEHEKDFTGICGTI